MLTFDNPVETSNAFSDYVVDHFASIPTRLQDLAKAASRERSPVVSVVKGMELMYALVSEEGWEGEAEPAYNVLGALAHQVAENDFWSRSDRALLLQRVVKHELGELPKNASVPARPEVDPEYATRPSSTEQVQEPSS